MPATVTPPTVRSRVLSALSPFALIAPLLLLTGCPERTYTAAPDATGTAGAQTTTPEALSPEKSPAPAAIHAAATEREPGPAAGGLSANGTQPPVLVAAAQPYIPPAGRSAIPKEGEAITQPLPAIRLVPEAQSEPPAEGAIIPWEEAAQFLGHEATVEGTIVDTFLLQSGNICFLNFKKNDRQQFYLAVFKSAFEGLPESPDVYYLNKTIRVTGPITVHKQRPQIEVHAASQISVVE